MKFTEKAGPPDRSASPLAYSVVSFKQISAPRVANTLPIATESARTFSGQTEARLKSVSLSGNAGSH